MKDILKGAIVGDYMGSAYEFAGCKDYNFKVDGEICDITDDSILTIAIADACISGMPYALALQYWASKFPIPMGGYGNGFSRWLGSYRHKPYNSFGNGAAMRISAIGWLYSSLERTLKEAEAATKVTHNHEEGIKGAKAVAACIWLLRNGYSRAQVTDFVEKEFGYNVSTPLDEIRPTYGFDESCQRTVPVAIRCYLESSHFEDAVRLAVSMGGDADTLGAITGSIALADNTYDIPQYLLKAVNEKLTPAQRMVCVEIKEMAKVEIQ